MTSGSFSGADVLVKRVDATATDDEIVEFLRCLTIIPFDLDQEQASRDRLAAVDRLIPIVGDAAEAQKVWSSLNAIASRIIPSGGGVDRAASRARCKPRVTPLAPIGATPR